MPLKSVHPPCNLCDGTGSRRCDRCDGSGSYRRAGVNYGTCWKEWGGCGGTGKVICTNCRGTGEAPTTVRAWVPDYIEETRGKLAELEEAVRTKSYYRVWRIVHVFWDGYKYLPQESRQQLFPDNLLKQFYALRQELPKPCLHCFGRLTPGADCVFCNGSGLQESEEVLQRVVDKVADVRMPSGGTLGKEGTSQLQVIRGPNTVNKPAPEMEAPEIEGEDIDGKKFRLSDYKGKVILLDFWGHW